MALSPLLTEAAAWDERNAVDYACAVAASGSAPAVNTTVDPDLLPAALAVPLAAPMGCPSANFSADAVFNATGAALQAAADPKTVTSRLYALGELAPHARQSC
jgi:hypothetical protein